MTELAPVVWQPIETARIGDVWVWVRWEGGAEQLVDLDHESDARWWARRGATHWRPATNAEIDRWWYSPDGG